MTKKAPKQPRLLKLPKKPKANASVAVLDRYMDRVAETKRKNSEKIKEYNAKKAAHESAKKKHTDLKNKVSKLGPDSVKPGTKGR